MEDSQSYLKKILESSEKQIKKQETILKDIGKYALNEKTHASEVCDKVDAQFDENKDRLHRVEKRIKEKISDCEEECQSEIKEVKGILESSLGKYSPKFGKSQALHARLTELIEKIGTFPAKQDAAEILTRISRELEGVKSRLGVIGDDPNTSAHVRLKNIQEKLGAGLNSTPLDSCIRTLMDKISALAQNNHAYFARVGADVTKALENGSQAESLLNKIIEAMAAQERHLLAQDVKIQELADAILHLKEHAHAVLDNKKLIDEYKAAAYRLKEQREKLSELNKNLVTGWESTFKELHKAQKNKIDEQIGILQKAIDEENQKYVELQEKEQCVERDLELKYKEEYANILRNKREYEALKKEKETWEKSKQGLESTISKLIDQLQRNNISPEV